MGMMSNQIDINFLRYHLPERVILKTQQNTKNSKVFGKKVDKNFQYKKESRLENK